MLARDTSRLRPVSACWISTADSAQDCSSSSSRIARRAPPRRYPALVSARAACSAQPVRCGVDATHCILRGTTARLFGSLWVEGTLSPGGEVQSPLQAFELGDLPLLEVQ